MNHYADRRANAVAIVSPDPLLAALLGAAVELLGFRVEFPRAGESPSETLRRAKPTYLLIDADDASASDESLLGRGLMRETRICLFGSHASTTRLAALAARYRAGVIVLPRDATMLDKVLTRRHSAPQDRIVE